MQCAPRYDPEHWNPRRHLLELGKRRILVNGQMRPRARCPLQVGLQHGRTPVRGHLFKVHLLATSMTESDMATRRLYVSHPVHLLSKHGHQVALTCDDSHDERKTDHVAGSPAPHL